MATPRERVLIGLAMLSGCLAMAIAGTVYSFNSYINAIKLKFNYTQSQSKS